LEPFKDENRSYVSVWNWIQIFGSLQIYRRKRVSAFIIDETIIQIGDRLFWLWISIEPVYRSVLEIYICEERNMFVAENFIKSLVEKDGKHIVYTDDGGTWYPQACNFLRLKHRLHSPLEKNLIERVMQFSRTELRILMITIHIVINKIVIYHMYTIGSNYSFTYIMQESEIHLYSNWR
jgi:transposase-like protein